ncbi:MAG: urease accessory UreF family protein [Alphaproteobacteria bacterium]|nr:urease accessory UreF family protein [Alphaproteobacteria bacterium]MDP6257335.1 urease accessory UreF family protein [Alphaproteobacteria bacterium]MDP7053694.1 urease accessory UreF family protein [Alphaproteobacteria bacterium]MDP7230701.1 urease accessory UreF family protein [Alphaproteobacteria bacterium]MDP7460085.1 urease accessory UreF family protein [Alphaproteobacteria bacterium]
MSTEARQLMRLQSWLSPAFPIGSFSYSHGLEYAVEAELLHDRGSLINWLEADLRHGTGRSEAIFFTLAATLDDGNFLELAELAAASISTSELARESLSQGEFFLLTALRAWPNAALRARLELLRKTDIAPTLAVATAMTCTAHGIDTNAALHLYLQAWLANLINAAVRLIPLGQTDGQMAQAELEDAVIATAMAASTLGIEDLGSAATMVEWASMLHEIQYTRLFRS